MKHIYFYNLEDLNAHFEDDVLEELIDLEDFSGKHDVTNSVGYYYQGKSDSYWRIDYALSYSDGFQVASVTGPFSRHEEVVTITKNVWRLK